GQDGGAVGIQGQLQRAVGLTPEPNIEQAAGDSVGDVAFQVEADSAVVDDLHRESPYVGRLPGGACQPAYVERSLAVVAPRSVALCCLEASRSEPADGAGARAAPAEAAAADVREPVRPASP